MRELDPNEVRRLAKRVGTPLFVYDEAGFEQSATEALAFPCLHDLTVRAAIKACTLGAVLKGWNDMGIEVDASSEFEVDRAMKAGFPGSSIMLTSQQPITAARLRRFDGHGVIYNACSLHQLEQFGQTLPGKHCCVRINPGEGSGHVARTNVGGRCSSFGIWHEYVPQVLELARQYNLTVNRLHTHIGSGSDPVVWVRVAERILETVAQFPDVTTLSLGGGFKVARMPDEVATDLQLIGNEILPNFREFEVRTGRKINIEIEPGTYLAANNAVLILEIVDIVDTGKDGYVFYKVNGGMTELARPTMYGAQHPMWVVAQNGRTLNETQPVIVSGHNCESCDILTPAPGNSEALGTRELAVAEIGDFLVIGGVGAYGFYMAFHGYNSFPTAAQVMKTRDGSFRQVCYRGRLEQLTQNECDEAL